MYVLQSSSKPNYYIGFTKNLKVRFKDHNSGGNTSTKRGIPWKLVYCEGYESENFARQREKRLKKYGKAWQELKKRFGSYST